MKSVTSNIVTPVAPSSSTVSAASSSGQGTALPPAQGVDTDNTEGAKQQRQGFEQSGKQQTQQGNAQQKQSSDVATHLSKEALKPNQSTQQQANSVTSSGHHTTKATDSLALTQVANLLKGRQNATFEIVVIKAEQKLQQATNQLLQTFSPKPANTYTVRIENQLVKVESTLPLMPGNKLLVNLQADGNFRLQSPWQLSQPIATPVLQENVALLERQLSLALPKQGNIAQSLQTISQLFNQLNTLLPALPKQTLALQSIQPLAQLMQTLQQLPNLTGLQAPQLQQAVLQSGILLEGKLVQSQPLLSQPAPAVSQHTPLPIAAGTATPQTLLSQAMQNLGVTQLISTSSSASTPAAMRLEGQAMQPQQVSMLASIQQDLKVQLQSVESSLRQDTQAVRAHLFGNPTRNQQLNSTQSKPNIPTKNDPSLMTYTPGQVTTKSRVQPKSTGSVQSSHLQIAQMLGKLHQQAIEAVARIQSNQSNALLQNAQQGEQSNQHLQTDLVFQHQGKLESVNLEIDAQHEQAQEQSSEKESVWNIGLNFDIPDVGEFKATIGMRDGKVSVTFTSEVMDTLKTLNNNVHKLRDSLTEKEVDIEKIQCLKGKLTKEKTHLSHHLIDIKT